MCLLILCVCSEAVASYGKSVVLPQITYSSTANILADPDIYPFCGRTCFNDDYQSRALVSILEDLDIIPYVAVIYRGDLTYYAEIATTFATRFSVMMNNYI
jgi:ABC-type branched-subunit amino acid transport system substrate-binding protein